MSIEQKLIDLEVKLSFQEDLIEELNNNLVRANLKIQNLERALYLLNQKVKAQQGSNIASLSEETPPPHY